MVGTLPLPLTVRATGFGSGAVSAAEAGATEAAVGATPELEESGAKRPMLMGLEGSAVGLSARLAAYTQQPSHVDVW